MAEFAAYGHTLISLAGVALLWAVMGPWSSIVKERAGAAPGGDVAQDYGDVTFRWQRAFANLVESLPAFGVAAVAAMLAGASPFWVNLAASLFFVSRIAVAVVHVRGLGKPAGGMRSIVFTVGWLMIVVLAILAIVAVF